MRAEFILSKARSSTLPEPQPKFTQHFSIVDAYPTDITPLQMSLRGVETLELLQEPDSDNNNKVHSPVRP
jgi:hypothetical protein